jgi:ATP-dependent DNA ligase
MHERDVMRKRLERLLSEEARSALREASPPERAELMEPSPMEPSDPDPGPDWIFEPLFDGVRCLAVRDGDSLALLDHGQRPLRVRIPRIERALRQSMAAPFAVDGAILDVDPDFEQGMVLSDVERGSNSPAEHVLEPRFLAFDLLHLAGYDLTHVALEERRRALRELFTFSPTFMYARESSAPARNVFDQALREGWRGVIAKRLDAPYEPRAPTWRAWRKEAEGEESPCTDPR